MIRTSACCAVAVACALVAAPASAVAPRWASPTGSGSACTQAQPCGLFTAVGSASAQEVIVTPGNYGYPIPYGSTLKLHAGETLHGQAGQPRPAVHSSASIGVG